MKQHRSVYQAQITEIFKDLKMGSRHHSQDRSQKHPVNPSAAPEKRMADKDTGRESYQQVVARMLADAREDARRKAGR